MPALLSELLTKSIVFLCVVTLGGCRSPSRVLSFNELRQIDREELERRASAGPDRVSALCIQGERLVEAGANMAAQEAFRTALEIDPNAIYARSVLLVLDFRESAPGFTEVSLRSLAKEHPHEFSPLLSLGDLYLSEREVDRAIEWFQKSEKLRQDDSQVAFRLGASYGLKGRADLAMPLLSRACEAAPGVARYHLGLAEQLLKQGKQDEARQHLSMAEKCGRPTGPLRYWQAKAAVAEDSDPRAEAHARERLKDAIKLAPSWLAPRVALARQYLRQGQDKAAVDVLEQSLSTGRGDDDFVLTLAHAYARNGRSADAKVIEDTYRKNKSERRKLLALMAAIEDPDASVSTLRTFAREMRKVGGTLSALNAYRRIRSLAPRDPDAIHALHELTSPPVASPVR